MLGNHRKYYYDYLHDTKQSPRVIFWNCFVHRLTNPDKDDYLTAELTLISQMIILPSLPLFNQYQEYICTIILPEGYRKLYEVGVSSSQIKIPIMKTKK